MKKSEMLGPRNRSEVEIFAVEGFRVEVIYQLQKVLNVKRISYNQLAELLNITENECLKLFEDENDLSIRMLARICHAIGCEIKMLLKSKNS